MARTYSQIKRLIDGKLQKAAGTITDSAFQEGVNLALDALRGEVDFPESQKTQSLSPALFKDVVLYTPPSDLYGDAIIDIRPLVEIPSSSINNSWDRNTTVEFETNLLGDRAKNKWTIEYNNGSKFLRLLGNLQQPVQNILLNSCDSYDGNGTWTADATTDAANVQTNTLNYFEGSGSVSFDISVAQSGNNYARIYNPSMTTVDMSNLTTPYLFFYVYLPSSTYVTSLNFVVGSDSSATPSTKANYYTFTATTQFDGSSLVSGRNLIGIPLSSAVQTGTVTTTSIRYLELTVNYSASQANMMGVLLDGVYLREGILFEIRYYAQNIVVSASGTRKQYFTADDDTTLLEPESEQLLIEYASGYLAPNVKDLQTGKTYYDLGQLAIRYYTARHPKERRLAKKSWYYGATFT